MASTDVTLLDDDEIGAEPGNSLLPAMLKRLEVPELRTLLELRKRGWEDKSIDHAFSAQRASARSPSNNSKKVWFSMMRNAMCEMNDFASFLPRVGSYKFLDLGCCPGGFASYILSFNRNATGVGISLPVNQGGYEYSLDWHLRPRMRLIWADMSYYRLHPSAHSLRGQLLTPLPLRREEDFDLIILEGHYPYHTYRTPSFDLPEPWDNHRWWISQIIIALGHVKHGGTIVMKLSHIERANTAQTLYLLDVLSARLVTYKPHGAHARRGTFYAIAMGVGLGVQGTRRAEYVRRYQEHWWDISFGGADGRGRWSAHGDMNFVVSYEELVGDYLERVAELGKGLWVVQSVALRKMLDKADEKRSEKANKVEASTA